MNNTNLVSEAFGNQSVIFDDIYDTNPIVNYMRQIIRDEVLSNLQEGDHILEINSGTATDAIFFAQKGFRVTAVEISPGMVKQANQKIEKLQLQNQITVINDSFENIDQLNGSFDYVYSNFGGLNCTPNMPEIVIKLIKKLKKNGKATLTILPPFTIWEKLHILKADFKTAFRRKFKGPSKAHIEGVHFNCWYYNPAQLTREIKPHVNYQKITGICILVPPSFMENFPRRFPSTFKLLTSLDKVICRLPLLRSIGDYFMITFTKS